MPTYGFHSEWLTIGAHRVLIDRRCGFPDEQLRFVARLAVEICDHWHDHTFFEASGGSQRAYDTPYVVAVSHDDGAANTFLITVAALDSNKVAGLADHLCAIFERIYGKINFDCEVRIVDEGEVAGTEYNHIEHLSVQAGVAANRFFPSSQNRPPQ